MKKKGGFYSVFFGRGSSLAVVYRPEGILSLFSPFFRRKGQASGVMHINSVFCKKTGDKRLTKQVFYGMVAIAVQNGLVHKNGNNRQSFDIIHANSRYKLCFMLVCYLFNLMHKYKSMCMGYRRSHENKE